jgi:hypothetical protein
MVQDAREAQTEDRLRRARGYGNGSITTPRIPWFLVLICLIALLFSVVMGLGIHKALTSLTEVKIEKVEK